MRRLADGARWLQLRLQRPRATLWLLGALSAGSLIARLLYLDKPYNGTAHKYGLVFDEQYYVNAARVILGIHPTAGSHYAGAALYHDPNAEHPPLVKLLIATTMRIFGDNPNGWRVSAVIFGSLAILAMYWLVRSARGSAWLALAAATLMAVDNLTFIHERIATLDIYVLTLMLVTVALYLRGHMWLAGLALGIGLCMKLVAVDVVFVLLLFEGGRLLWRNGDELRTRTQMARERAIPFVKVIGTGAVTYFALLFLMDLLVAPIGGPGDCPTVNGGFHNPIVHTLFMTCYAGKLTSPGGPTGIASYPWQWLLNQESINYYTLTTRVVSGGKTIAHNVVMFQGQMNGAIIFLALPALGVALHSVRRLGDTFSLLALAWFAGTFVPFVIAALPLGTVGSRTSYLYYMVVVLPAVFMAVVQMLAKPRFPLAALMGYAAIVAYGFVALYPIRSWSGG